MSSQCLRSLTLSDHYATNRNDLLQEFYSPCLNAASAYDRAVGYFRSSFLLLAARPVAELAQRGGRIRVICSPELSESDILAFEQGYQWRESIGEALVRSIEAALAEAHGKPLVEFVATLIAVGCLDIRIAFRPGAEGIFHDKVGILRDMDGHAISFIGSINETFQAWSDKGNHESFDVFCSWKTDAPRVERHTQYFERLWNGQETGVETIHFPAVARERLIPLAHPDGPVAALAKVHLARTAKGKVALLHQVSAIENWRLHDCRGILEHATGSGKTFTAITAMRDWLAQRKPVLVLVPSDLLLSQWYAEITSELTDVEPLILLAGAGHDDWRKADILEGFSAADGVPCIIIAMLQTASTPDFLLRLRSGRHLMIIADEVHRVGSPKFSSVLSIDAGARLGLSATPRRYGDPEGTERILQYFGGVIDPTFTLADAIAAGRLTPYNYHVHTARLTEEEIREWRRLSLEIRRRIAASKSTDDTAAWPEEVKKLLIRRARILKQANNKVSLAVDVILAHYQPEHRWLVYCDNREQLGRITQALIALGLPCHEYYSAMLGDRDATLEHFAMMGGILVAIRCLDEGVNIPTIDHALILASSRNPREFIQRRGRVLRKAPDKFYAEIHDALVLPPLGNREPDDAAILSGELSRALEFAKHATNDAVRFSLWQIAREADVNLTDAEANAGFEDEENGDE